MIQHSTALAVLAGLLLLTFEKASAQAPQPGAISFSMDGGAVHQSNADLKSGGGFEADQWFVSAGVKYRWNFVNSVGLTVGGGQYNYDFDPDTGFGGGSPWSEVNDFRISAPMSFKLSEKAIAFIVPTYRYNREAGAEAVGDTWGVFAAVAWQIRKGLSIGPGFGYFTKLDEGSNFFPVIAVDWDINEHWNLSTGSGLAATQGPGLTLKYKATEKWDLGLSGRYENNQFRLDEKGVAPGGVARDQGFPLVVSGIYGFTEEANVSLFAGLKFGGKLKIEDAFDVIVDESTYDPAFLIGMTFKLGF